MSSKRGSLSEKERARCQRARFQRARFRKELGLHSNFIAAEDNERIVLAASCDVREAFRREWTFRRDDNQDLLARSHIFQGRGRTPRQETVPAGAVRRRRRVRDPSEQDQIVHSVSTATGWEAVSSRRSGVETVTKKNTRHEQKTRATDGGDAIRTEPSATERSLSLLRVSHRGGARRMPLLLLDVGQPLRHCPKASTVPHIPGNPSTNLFDSFRCVSNGWFLRLELE